MISIFARIYEADGDRVPNTDPTIEIDVEKYISTKPLDFVVDGKTIQEWIESGYAVDFLVYNTRTKETVSVKRLRSKWLDLLCCAEEEDPENPNTFGLVEHIWGQKMESGNILPCYVVG